MFIRIKDIINQRKLKFQELDKVERLVTIIVRSVQEKISAYQIKYTLFENKSVR